MFPMIFLSVSVRICYFAEKIAISSPFMAFPFVASPSEVESFDGSFSTFREDVSFLLMVFARNSRSLFEVLPWGIFSLSQGRLLSFVSSLFLNLQHGRWIIILSSFSPKV
ncbi:hypothetical protein SAY86_001565 [Trapa natans]|uniref:Uncharacterized protein n=1 Tax=Trapa natans TaxID=22666 RepID=A0AAN7MRF5_TRANT|nr:hypothetical protein SAY86_001565 [Trapa natans]